MMKRPVKMLNRMFFLICMQGLYLIANAQVKTIGIEKGLSNNSVTSIYQDKKGFMWFGTYNGLNRYDGYTFKTFKNSLTDSTSLPNNRISCIGEDGQGSLWVGNKLGAHRMGKDGNSFERVYFINEGTSSKRQLTNPVNCFMLDEKGTFYIGSAGEGLLMKGKNEIAAKQIPILENKNRVYQYHVQAIAEDSSRNVWVFIQNKGIARVDERKGLLIMSESPVDQANCMAIDHQGRFWLGTNRGLYLFQKQGKAFISNNEIGDSLPQDPIVAIKEDVSGNVWLAYDGNGLYKYHSKSDEFVHYSEQAKDNRLASDAVYALFEDRDQRLWIGTLRGGVNVLDYYAHRFKTVKEGELSGKQSRDFILSFCEEDPNVVWIGTDGAGLKRWNREENSYLYFEHRQKDPKSLSSNFVVSLLRDDRFLWIATYGGGINRMDLDTYEIKKYTCYNDRYHHVNPYTWGLYKDKYEQIWVGTLSDGGIYRYDKGTDTFRMINDEVRNVLTFMEDHRGDLWAGRYDRLSRLDASGRIIEEFEIEGGVRSMALGVKHDIWIGTEGGGLKHLDIASKHFTTFSESDGLPENAILNILPDQHGKYWLSTYKGLSEFDPATTHFRNFFESEGLQSNQFNYNAALTLSTGEMLFGGINGFNIFDPAAIAPINTQTNLAITNIRINNKALGVSEIEGEINDLKELLLTYDRAVLSVDFANLEYSFPDKIAYAFWLEGWEKDWNYVGQNRSANYGKLPPGKYTLHIKATDANGQWTSAERILHVTISPPWWATSWAYLFYGIGAVALVQLYLHNRRKSLQLKFEADKARYEMEQEHELNEKKIAFFTHVSHELRTPLTLIVGPLSDLLNRYKSSSDEKELKTVYKNSKRLLSMVDQLLLFKKMEAGREILHVQRLDGRKLCFDVYECYEQQAIQRRIAYIFDDSALISDGRSLSADKEKLEVMLFNLLSNAFKHTPDGGTIALRIRQEGEAWIFSISDDGLGVPADFRDKLFERFSRDEHHHKSGFGIGLYLVREYALLHGGSVEYRALKKGSEFVVKLPLATNNAQIADMSGTSSRSDLLEELMLEMDFAGSEDVDLPNLTKPIVERKPMLMVVDDEKEIRRYIKQIFDKHFQVRTYASALTAMEDLRKGIVPVLILSDVMMPDMDGIAFCQQLKTAQAWRTIPLILLTADASEENDLKGISCGADGYMHKPFSSKLLMAKVDALVKKQAFFEEQAYQDILLKTSKEGLSDEESLFLDRCEAAILKTVNEEESNVKALGASLGMGHSSFYKKIKQLTGRSISDFARFVRLRKAAQNLLEEEMNINQAAFSVGYSDVKYFREQFQKEFGMTPSEFVKKYRDTFQKKYHLHV